MALLKTLVLKQQSHEFILNIVNTNDKQNMDLP